MDRLNEVAKTYKMKINVKKTKTMIVSQTEGEQLIFRLKDKKWSKLKF